MLGYDWSGQNCPGNQADISSLLILMAKKKRTSVNQPGFPAPYDLSSANPAGTLALPNSPGSITSPLVHPQSAVGPSTGAPEEVERGDWTVVLLACMIFLAPAIGVPHEEMLQDTLKSMLVSFFAVFTGLLFFWRQRLRTEALRWHALMWLPLGLMFYALGSMAWSHAFLAGVEAIRWFVFSLLLWLGINTLTRARRPYLIEGIHWGAVLASVWTALQFWLDFSFFPQGPNPASTFVNRNFYAEFVVCTLPFSAWLLAQAKGSTRISLLAFTLGLNIVALMMTGTRGALSAMWLTVLLVLPVIAVLYRKQFALGSWDAGQRLLAGGLLIASIVGMGGINTGNPKLMADSAELGTSAFDRAFKRTASISAEDNSLGVRLIMWKATARMIQDNPLTGVGAGAWEARVPLYQSEGSQLETDYYVHNEILQLLAEYGLTGLLFLIALFAYLLAAAWKTVKNRSPEGLAEAPLRAVVLSSLLAFLIVSNIGFPWRLASTGALFALCLALLAASDARLQQHSAGLASRIDWKPVYSKVLGLFMVFCLSLTAYISQQAAAAERNIVMAVKLALTVSNSRNYNHPQWEPTKKQLLALVRDGIAINTHYRKITPMVADELARWGDWKNAVWIWESVVESRPYVVAIMSNIARGYAQMGNYDKALEYLARSEKLQPKAQSVRSLKVILLSRTGKEPEAASLARQSLQEGAYDYDLANAAYVLGMRSGDYDMAIQALELRNKGWPNAQVDGLLKLGSIYTDQKKDDAKALLSFRAAIAATPDSDKNALRQRIPAAYLTRL